MSRVGEWVPLLTVYFDNTKLKGLCVVSLVLSSLDLTLGTLALESRKNQPQNLLLSFHKSVSTETFQRLKVEPDAAATFDFVERERERERESSLVMARRHGWELPFHTFQVHSSPSHTHTHSDTHTTLPNAGYYHAQPSFLPFFLSVFLSLSFFFFFAVIDGAFLSTFFQFPIL